MRRMAEPPAGVRPQYRSSTDHHDGVFGNDDDRLEPDLDSQAEDGDNNSEKDDRRPHQPDDERISRKAGVEQGQDRASHQRHI